MNKDELYMQRCVDLAIKGGQRVKSNPHVGAVIVFNDTVIGEGYHEKYGNPHAEINALKSVKSEHLPLLKDSTIYVSLEPCNHHGKTPPCTEAIIKSGIRKVVIGSTDPNPLMMGKSILSLKKEGINVRSGIFSQVTDQVIKRFEANMKGLPFVTIKFAQSKDFFIGKKEERVIISNPDTSIFTHKLRAQNDGILVGTNTCILDNPSLTTRHYPGKDPLRIVLDRNERIPKSHTILADSAKTIIYTQRQDYQIQREYKTVIQLEDWELSEMLKSIFRGGVNSLLVEGGAKVIRWFIKEKMWDEAYIISSKEAELNEGVRAPKINGNLISSFKIRQDEICHIRNMKI